MSDLTENELRRLYPLADPTDFEEGADPADVDTWRRSQRAAERAERRVRDSAAEKAARDEEVRRTYGPSGAGLSGNGPRAAYSSGDEIEDRVRRTAKKIQGSRPRDSKGIIRPITVQEAEEFIALAGGRTLQGIARTLRRPPR